MPDRHIQAVDLAIQVTNKTTIWGAVTGFVGWLAELNWVGLSGGAAALIGVAANIYFQHRREQRESRESEARIQALRARIENDRRQRDIPVENDRRRPCAENSLVNIADPCAETARTFTEPCP